MIKKLSSIFLMAGIAASTVTAHANDVVHIKKRNSQTFAIDGDRGAANAQSIYLWSANANNVNQQWIEIDRGNGYYSYQKQGTSHCIDGGRGGAKNQDVYLWTCFDNNQNQHWLKEKTDSGYFKLIKRNSSGFAINGGSNGKNKQNVNLYNSSNSSHNLQWKIEKVGQDSNTKPTIIDADTIVKAGTTDQLQSAIDEAHEDGGGIVRLEAGTHYLTRSIQPKSDVTIIGSGSLDSLITWSDSVADTIDTGLFNQTRGSESNIGFENLAFDCRVDITDLNDRDRTGTRAIYITGGGSQFEIDSLPFHGITMTNLYVTNCGGEAIQIKGAHDIVATDLKFENNGWGTSDLWHNIYFKRVNGVVMTQTTPDSGYFRNSPSGHGMRLSDMEDVYFEGLTVEGNADHGMHMDNVSNFRGHNLNVGGNCAIPNGLCRETACYNSCDYDLDSAKE